MNRVLIVDDEPIIRLSLAKKVKECDETAIVAGTAADGQEALKWLGGHFADLCITDVKMPNMNGLELIRSIKTSYPWMHCIVVSSYDDFSYVKQSLELNVIDYILKPVDTTELRRVLKKAMAEMSRNRKDAAARLLLNKLPHHRDMLERWLKAAETLLVEKIPLLIVDTLDMLESWVQRQYHLLPELATQWLGVVYETLLKECRYEPAALPAEIRATFEMLTHAQLRTYFRVCAVHDLERGACQLIARMQEERNRKGSRIVAQVKEYVEKHYAGRITLQDVADALGISRTYLASLFKQETGMTFLNYLVSVRMEKARELLLNTPMKVYEITSSVGYENSIHFAKLFKEYFGLNPMEYKKRMGG